MKNGTIIINWSLIILLFITIASCSYDRNSKPSKEKPSKNNYTNFRVDTAIPKIKTLNPSISYKLYLESSGSMYSYDDVSCQGQFKKAIVTLLNKLNSINPIDSEKIIYIVNNDIYPQHKTFTQFIQENNIFKSSIGVGDPRFTDFEKI